MMKKYLRLALTVGTFLIVGCTNSANSKTDSNAVSTEKKVEASAEPIEINSDQFKKLVFDYETNNEWKFEGDKPCVVDFYATWCGPCKALAPIIHDLAKEYEGKVNFYKVDVDKSKDLAAAFGIRSIPTLLFIPVKGEPQMAQGALPKEDMVKAITEIMK